jgi:hypothetical protein
LLPALAAAASIALLMEEGGLCGALLAAAKSV